MKKYNEYDADWYQSCPAGQGIFRENLFGREIFEWKVSWYIDFLERE